MRGMTTAGVFVIIYFVMKLSTCGSNRESLPKSGRLPIPARQLLTGTHPGSCAPCGLQIGRDVNSARNLEYYGLAALKGHTESSPGGDACGDISGGGSGELVYKSCVVEAGSNRSFIPSAGNEINDYALRNGCSDQSNFTSGIKPLGRDRAGRELSKMEESV